MDQLSQGLPAYEWRRFVHYNLYGLKLTGVKFVVYKLQVYKSRDS